MKKVRKKGKGGSKDLEKVGKGMSTEKIVRIVNRVADPDPQP